MTNPIKLAVFGNPIKHSFSPFIHQQFAKQFGDDISYEKIMAPKDNFKSAVETFIKDGGNGFNITVPFKEEAYALCDTLSALATEAQSVNTIKIMPDKTLTGENTDGQGLIHDLQENNHFSLHNKNILLLGAGGAARGVLGPLFACQPKTITLANRTLEKAERVAEHFKNRGAISVCALDEKLNGHFDLIINATSAGLKGDDLPLSPNVFSSSQCCYDMVYASSPTPFVNMAKAANVRLCIDGIGMLVEQAKLAYAFWLNKTPETAPVIEAIKKHINHYSIS